MTAAREQFRVRRFDADREDREIGLDDALRARPTKRQLLWIDAVGEIDPDDLARLGERFGFDEQTSQALATSIGQPHLAVYGTYFHVSVALPGSGKQGTHPSWLDIVASELVVITRHAEPVGLLDEIDERVKADAALGAVEGAEFVALILDAVVTSYFAAVDEIEDAVDSLDARSLRDDGRSRLLDELVELRRRIARLRRTVTGHRSVYAGLTGPDMRQVIEGTDAVEDLQAVSSRFEAAVGAVEASRDSLLGSFDVYMTRTAQRTNDVMKVLTIATVLLLPGTVIAGLLGMNVVVPLNKDEPASFWIVVGGVVLLALVVIAAARWRRWI